MTYITITPNDDPAKGPTTKEQISGFIKDNGLTFKEKK